MNGIRWRNQQPGMYPAWFIFPGVVVWFYSQIVDVLMLCAT
jgi:hypothetical protein